MLQNLILHDKIYFIIIDVKNININKMNNTKNSKNSNKKS